MLLQGNIKQLLFVELDKKIKKKSKIIFYYRFKTIKIIIIMAFDEIFNIS